MVEDVRQNQIFSFPAPNHGIADGMYDFCSSDHCVQFLFAMHPLLCFRS